MARVLMVIKGQSDQGGQDINMIISEDVTREIEDVGINRGGD
jgi:hypothetical protein